MLCRKWANYLGKGYLSIFFKNQMRLHSVHTFRASSVQKFLSYTSSIHATARFSSRSTMNFVQENLILSMSRVFQTTFKRCRPRPTAKKGPIKNLSRECNLLQKRKKSYQPSYNYSHRDTAALLVTKYIIK